MSSIPSKVTVSAGGVVVNQQGMVSYKQELEQEMMQYCTEQLLRFIPQDKFFPCTL